MENRILSIFVRWVKRKKTDEREEIQSTSRLKSIAVKGNLCPVLSTGTTSTLVRLDRTEMTSM